MPSESNLLEITAPNHYVEWVLTGNPGQFGGRAWTDADTITVDVYHEAELALPVRLRFGVGEYSNEDQVMTAAYGVLPGVRTRLTFPLTALNAETVFLPRTPGRLKATLQGRPARPADITWFAIGAGNVGRALAVELSNITLTDAPPPLVPDGPVLVDELGQWSGRDWPGKTPDAEALVADLRAAASAPAPDSVADRDQYGGSTEITFGATGFFRTHHDGYRWWLVDPGGGAFWSAGADCVGVDGGCPVDGNEALCRWLPPSQAGEYADAWRGSQFAWPVANLIRAFGPQWRDAWANLTRRSLVGFGFNTIGNWSDIAFAQQSRIPYVLPLADFPTTAQTVFRDFPDVFAPEFAENAQKFAQQLKAYRDDPFLIGYFLRNEPLWAFGVFRLAEELLTHDPSRAPHSRQALVEHLRSRYASGEDFAAAWGPLVTGPDAVASYLLTDLSTLSEQAVADLAAFSRRMVDAYVRIPSEACRVVDPNHLNLGMRWAWIASDDLLAGSDACDVFSMNCYDVHISPETVQRAAQASGRPVLIGEFHFGAIDRGLLSGGLRGVPTQADRGQAYRYYVEQAAALPDVIGAHYFQWNDQPFLGRFDGENWQIGLVDVCHNPYPEFVAAARQTHQDLYAVAAGRRLPLSTPPPEGPKLGI